MKRSVLVVEDNAEIRTIMRILISSYGYEVVEARDGSEAVEEAKKRVPDLILMDLMMPIMDGFTATRLIREDDRLKKIPILAITAYGKTYLERAMEVGFDAVISKPLDFSSLDQLLKQYCRNGDESAANN